MPTLFLVFTGAIALFCVYAVANIADEVLDDIDESAQLDVE